MATGPRQTDPSIKKPGKLKMPVFIETSSFPGGGPIGPITNTALPINPPVGPPPNLA